MIKTIDQSNISEIKTLFLKVFTAPPWNDEWKSDEDVTRYINDLISHSNSLTIGYYINDELIGISLGYIYHRWTGKEYFIKEFCIDQDYQHQGHGSLFINELETYLLSQNLSAYWLTTERDFPAHHFYLKNGFHELHDIVYLAKNIKKY